MTITPLADIRHVEFCHMVMGPSCGLVLGDLGADVIKVEPIDGDNTRRLTGSGAGLFPTFNRNKRSIALDMKTPEGMAIAWKLIKRADVMTENFRPGAMEKLGLGADAALRENPRLIHCALKGFLKGPYEHRAALDEVVQMMGGLAYMTGPPGRPLRAGASVNDIMGGMFAAIAILSALRERDRTGKGQAVKASLYENSAFLVAQHMAQFLVTGKAAAPMPARIAAWSIYDVFDTGDGGQVFVGVVTDTQWKQFCLAFGRPDLAADATLATNPMRVAARPRLMPIVAELFAKFPKAELMAKLESCGLPYAPIVRPEDLFDDPQLNAAGGMLPFKTEDGREGKLPGLPIEMGGERPRLHRHVPKIGEQSREILAELGYARDEIERLAATKVIAG